jgi:oligopeptide transport system substrate-binding protein
MIMTSSIASLTMSLAQAADRDVDAMRVLLDESGKEPFGQHASMVTLSFFNINVLGQLLRVSDSLEIEHGLIDKVEYSFERKEYVLKLRSGIRFHNGRLADAKDLEFSILRGFFSKTPSLFKLYLWGIEGIEDAAIGNFKSGGVSGVKIIDNLTVSVKLKHPNPSFLHSLSEPYFSLVAREALDESYVVWKKFPIGAGPYKVKESEGENGRVRIEKVDKGSPGPGIVDLFTLDLATRYEFSFLNSHKVENQKIEFSKDAGGVQAIHFSRLNPLSINSDFRKALVHTFDREALEKKLPGSKSTWEMLPSQFWGRTGERKSFDVEKARGLVAKIPENLRKKTWKLEVFNGRPEPEPVVAEILSQLNRVGLSFEYSRGTEKFRSVKTATEVPLFSSVRISNFIDPLIAFAAYLPTGPEPFLTFESDPTFESAYVKAAESISRESRIETIQGLSRQINEKIVCIPLLEKRWSLFYDSKRVARKTLWGNLGVFKLQDVELAK